MSAAWWTCYCPEENCRRHTVKAFYAQTKNELMLKITQHASAVHEEIIPCWTAAHKDFIDRTAEQWDSKMVRFVDHDAPPKQRVDSPRTPQWDPKTESFSHDAPPRQRADSPRSPQWDPKTESFSHDAPPKQVITMSAGWWTCYCPEENCRRHTVKAFSAQTWDDLMSKISQHASAAHEEIVPFWTVAHKDFIDRCACKWDPKTESFDYDAPPKERVDSPRPSVLSISDDLFDGPMSVDQALRQYWRDIDAAGRNFLRRTAGRTADDGADDGQRGEI